MSTCQISDEYHLQLVLNRILTQGECNTDMASQDIEIGAMTHQESSINKVQNITFEIDIKQPRSCMFHFNVQLSLLSLYFTIYPYIKTISMTNVIYFIISVVAVVVPSSNIFLSDNLLQCLPYPISLFLGDI